jgi:hypothetical protein
MRTTDSREDIETLVKDVLAGTQLRYCLDSHLLEEDFESGRVSIECAVHNRESGEKSVVTGQGVGLVDAFFAGLVALHAEASPSLRTLRLADFSVRNKPASGRGAALTDSIAEVTVRLANAEGQETTFFDASPSVTRSSLLAVMQGVEFFLNTERAFVAVYRALQYARKENRPDSIALYTQQLALLVQATTYSEVVEQIVASCL